MLKSEKNNGLIPKLGFNPTGTTNYIMSEFNIDTKERTLLFEGGVPLHKIVYNLYDFFYNYINHFGSSHNKIFYIHAILKPESNCRPETPIIFKLKGEKCKNERLELYQKNINLTLEKFELIYNYLGTLPNTRPGQEKKTYRRDTSSSTFRDSKNHFSMVKEKLKNIENIK